MNWTRTWLCVAAAATVTAATGCEVGEIYWQRPGGKLGLKISPKASWRASGTAANPRAAIDGDLTTAARSSYRGGNAELTIDLGRRCLFEMIVIDHGEAQHGYARRVGVATSRNGKAYVDRYTAPGTRRVTHLMLPKPALARYVRLKVVAPGRRAWSVAEVYIQ